MSYFKGKFKKDDIVQYMKGGPVVYLKIFSKIGPKYSCQYISKITMIHEPLAAWDVKIELNYKLGFCDIEKKLLHKHGKLMTRLIS